jgi:hypothetical protein
MKPSKIKLPSDCEIFKLSGNFTFIFDKKEKKLLVNHIDKESNKLEWREVTQRKVWDVTTVGDCVILVASAGKQKTPQRESEQPLSEKKEKLRTAKNIIDKINWSGHLNPDEFTVAYLDKYDGILEIPFRELLQS